MSEANHCPHCGASLAPEGTPTPVNAPDLIGTPPVPAEAPVSLNDSIIDMPLLAPGSNDDTFLGTSPSRKVGPAEPDPLLGKFVAAGPSPSQSTDSARSKSLRPHKSSSSGHFPTINLDTSPKPASASSSRLAKTVQVQPEPEEQDEEADEPRSVWSSVLLASYTSAVTLALVWFVIRDRNRDKPEPIATPSTTTPEQQRPTNSDVSRKVQAPEPILGEHFAKLGKPIQIGSLEITPLDVKRRDVKLQRGTLLADPQVRDGGKKALVLRLKLRNTTENSIFAPLDPAYLREHGEKLVDTFVTTAQDERIYPYPLAIESEWSIVGQEFAELRPSESRIVAIVTSPDAPPDEAGPFTWRVRLRTGIDRTDILGLIWPAPTDQK